MAGGFQGTAFGLVGESSQALDSVSGFYQTAQIQAGLWPQEGTGGLDVYHKFLLVEFR